jgi:tripartite ATP-independent transporter DctM subunit
MLLGFAAALMVGFFAMGLYVAVALGLVAFSLMFFFADRPLWDILGPMTWNVNNSFLLAAIPMFVLMGELLIYSGISERMYRALSHWLAPLPGGLLHSNIAFSGVFGAVSGSSAAATAVVGSVALPAFRARGYNERLVMGSIAAGGTLDILIPPSIAMIIYGVLAEVSIGRLYLAGFIPGFLMVIVFMVIIAVVARIWPSVAPKEVAPSLRIRIIGLLSLLPFLALMFIVLGTIYLGVATPTEAAAFGVVGAFILAAINRQISIPMLRQALLATVRTTSLIMLIVTAAFIMSFALAILGVPAQLSEWVTGFNLTPVTFVIILVVFYLILGTFMETLSMMVTTVPIIVPVLSAMGADLVWFGIIMVILLEAALISPPEGLNLYVIQGLRRSIQTEHGMELKGTIVDVWIGVLPFMVGIAIVIALLIAFPEIALWLPNLVKGEAG